MDFPVGPREAERLRVLGETNQLRGESDPALDAICKTARERFDVQIALVTLLDAECQVFGGRSGLERTQTPRSDAFCNYTILTDEIFVVPDAKADPSFANNPLVTGEPYVRFYAGAPLIYLKEIRLGALCLLDRRPRQFSLGDRAELAELADLVVSEIASKEFASLPPFSR